MATLQWNVFLRTSAQKQALNIKLATETKQELYFPSMLVLLVLYHPTFSKNLFSSFFSPCRMMWTGRWRQPGLPARGALPGGGWTRPAAAGCCTSWPTWWRETGSCWRWVHYSHSCVFLILIMFFLQKCALQNRWNIKKKKKNAEDFAEHHLLQPPLIPEYVLYSYISGLHRLL